MELLGQIILLFKYSKIIFSWSRNTNFSSSIWWLYWNSTGATEEYDGSTWATSPGSMNTARQGLAGSVNGTQTAALGFGGNTTTLYRRINRSNMTEHLGQLKHLCHQQELN
jgi:hypothetical protein